MWEFSAPAWCDLTQTSSSVRGVGQLLLEDGYFEPNRMENPGGFDWSPERARALYGEEGATAINVPQEEELSDAASEAEPSPQHGHVYGNAVMEEMGDMLAPATVAATTPAMSRSHARSAARTRSASKPCPAPRSSMLPSPPDVSLEVALASEESDCSSLEVATAAPRMVSIAAGQEQSPARPRSVTHIMSPSARRIPTPRSELRSRIVPAPAAVASPQPRSGGGSSSRSLSLTLTDSSSRGSGPSTTRKPAFTPVASRGRAIALAAAFTPSTLGSTPSSRWTRLSSGNKSKRAQIMLPESVVAPVSASASPAASTATGTSRTPVSVPSVSSTPAMAAPRLSDARSASHGTTPESSTHAGDAEDAISAFTEALGVAPSMQEGLPTTRDAVRASVIAHAAPAEPLPSSAVATIKPPVVAAGKGPLVSLRDVQPTLARRVMARKQVAVASIANAAIAQAKVAAAAKQAANTGNVGHASLAATAQRVPVTGGAKSSSLRQRLFAMAKPTAAPAAKASVVALPLTADVGAPRAASAPVAPQPVTRGRAGTPTQRAGAPAKIATPMDRSVKRARRVPVEKGTPARAPTLAGPPVTAVLTTTGTPAIDTIVAPGRAPSVPRRQSTPATANASMVTPTAATRGRRRSDSIPRAASAISGSTVQATPTAGMHTPVQQQPAYVSFAEVMARFNSGLAHLEHTNAVHATPRGPPGVAPPTLPTPAAAVQTPRSTQVTPFHLHTEQRAHRVRRSSSVEPPAPSIAAPPSDAFAAPAIGAAVALGIAQKFSSSVDGTIHSVRSRSAARPDAPASIASMGATGVLRMEKKAPTQGVAPSFVKQRPAAAAVAAHAAAAAASAPVSTSAQAAMATGLKSRLMRMRHLGSTATIGKPAAGPVGAPAAAATVPVSPRLATKMRSLVKHAAVAAEGNVATAGAVPGDKVARRAALRTSLTTTTAPGGMLTGI